MSAVVAALLTVCCVLPLSGCASLSGWKTVKMQSDGVNLEHRCELELASSPEEIVETWINVTVQNDCRVTVDMQYYSTSKNKKTLSLTKSEVSKAKNGWILVSEGVKKDDGSYEKCNKAVISTYDTLTINEIVFVGKDSDGNAKLLKPTFTRGGVCAAAGKGESYYTSKETLEALGKNSPAWTEFPAYNVIDEQDKFPLELIKYGSDKNA